MVKFSNSRSSSITDEFCSISVCPKFYHKVGLTVSCKGIIITISTAEANSLYGNGIYSTVGYPISLKQRMNPSFEPSVLLEEDN